MTEDVDATVGIVDGRVAMTADGEATLYVDGREHRPLSTIETHATLRVEGEDFRAELALDGQDIDALADDLYHIQEGYKDD